MSRFSILFGLMRHTFSFKKQSRDIGFHLKPISICQKSLLLLLNIFTAKLNPCTAILFKGLSDENQQATKECKETRQNPGQA